MRSKRILFKNYCVCVFALVESFMSKRLSTCSVSRGTLLEPVTQWSESWTTFYTALLSDDLVCLRVAVRTDQCKNCVCACVFWFLFLCVCDAVKRRSEGQTDLAELSISHDRCSYNCSKKVWAKFSAGGQIFSNFCIPVPSDITFRRHKLKVSKKWKLI